MKMQDDIRAGIIPSKKSSLSLIKIKNGQKKMCICTDSVNVGCALFVLIYSYKACVFLFPQY